MRARMGRQLGFAATLSLAASPAWAQAAAPATKIVRRARLASAARPGRCSPAIGTAAHPALGVLATAAWCGFATFVLLRLVGLVFPLRASDEDEVVGLDISLHGEALQ